MFFCSAGLSRSEDEAGTITRVVGNGFVQEISHTIEAHLWACCGGCYSVAPIHGCAGGWLGVVLRVRRQLINCET